MADLLPVFYENFDKRRIAGFCKELADLAINSSDKLSISIFSRAGKILADHILGLENAIDFEEINVLLIGSVWNSLPLLGSSFFTSTFL